MCDTGAGVSGLAGRGLAEKVGPRWSSTPTLASKNGPEYWLVPLPIMEQRWDLAASPERSTNRSIDRSKCSAGTRSPSENS
jgi:hypothetical protein